MRLTRIALGSSLILMGAFAFSTHGRGQDSAQLHIGGGTLNVTFDATPSPALRQLTLDWINRAAKAVTVYYTRFPVKHVDITIHVGEGIRLHVLQKGARRDFVFPFSEGQRIEFAKDRTFGSFLSGCLRGAVAFTSGVTVEELIGRFPAAPVAVEPDRNALVLDGWSAGINEGWFHFRHYQALVLQGLILLRRHQRSGDIVSQRRLEHDVHDVEYLTLGLITGHLATNEVSNDFNNFSLQSRFRLFHPNGVLVTPANLPDFL